jgi:hypothetical protein
MRLSVRKNNIWLVISLSLLTVSIASNLVKYIFFTHSLLSSSETKTSFAKISVLKEDFIGRWQIDWVRHRSGGTVKSTGIYYFQRDGKFTSRFVFHIKDKLKNSTADLLVKQEGKWLVKSQKLVLMPQPEKVAIEILQSNLPGLTLEAVTIASKKEEVSSVYSIDRNTIKLVRYRADLLSDAFYYRMTRVK